MFYRNPFILLAGMAFVFTLGCSNSDTVGGTTPELGAECIQGTAEYDEPLELWPPNHKFHTISIEDCVVDACDEDVTVTFRWASSDEPVNDKGDGNTEPDIILECDRVQLRSERQGGGNGRIYKLGWEAVDAAGNRNPGVCVVVTVPHDQSGRKADDDYEPAYTMMLDEDECDDGTGGTGGTGGEGGEGGDDGAGGEGGEGGDDGAGGEGGVIVE